MSKDLKEQALEYHSMGKPGKIEIVPTKPHSTQTDLGLAYTPGVAAPCLEIEKDNNLAYEYTGKGNLVAVISNGTAVLGLWKARRSCSRFTRASTSLTSKSTRRTRRSLSKS